jgi:periplasmic protein TonB
MVQRLVIGVVLAAIGAGLWFAFQALMSGPKKVKPNAQQITLVKPNLPPPPPPKPPEKLPEPPKIKEEVKIDQPKQDTPKADEPPPAAKLGVDSDATGTGDGFGLAANRGGRDVTQSGGTVGTGTGTGTGTGAARASYVFYRDVVTRHLNDVLNRVPDLKDEDALVNLLLWIDASGKVEKIELIQGQVASDRANLIRSTVLASPALRQPPPEGMPQPVRVRVRIQDAG